MEILFCNVRLLYVLSIHGHANNSMACRSNFVRQGLFKHDFLLFWVWVICQCGGSIYSYWRAATGYLHGVSAQFSDWYMNFHYAGARNLASFRLKTMNNHSVNHNFMTLKILAHLSLSAQVATKPIIWQETLIVATNYSLILSQFLF